MAKVIKDGTPPGIRRAHPEVRKTSPRTRTGVVVHRVIGGWRIMGQDDRRAVISGPEFYPGCTELSRELLQKTTETDASGDTFLGRVVQFIRNPNVPKTVGETARRNGITHRNRTPLDLIGSQEILSSPPLHRRRQL